MIVAATILMGRGFDLTDESYYVLVIRDPFSHPDPLSHFGFVYHPIYLALGANVVALRVASVLATAGLGFWLGWLAWADRATRHDRFGFGMVAAALSLTSLNGWLPTPNYNILTVQAFLLAAIGLTAFVAHGGNALRTAPLVGVGGWLAYMGKPTSAAVLAILAAVLLASCGRLRTRFTVVAALTAMTLLFVSLTAIHGSPSAILASVAQARESAVTLQGGYQWSELLRIDRPPVGRLGQALCAAIIATVAGLTVLTAKAPRRDFPGLSIGVAMGTLAVIALMARYVPSVHPLADLLRMLPLTIALGAAIGTARRVGHRTTAMRDIALSLFFLVLPYAVAFGTNLNYWTAGSVASVFWVAACIRWITAAPPPQTSVAWPVAAACLFVTAILLVQGVDKPYRQIEAVWSQDAIIDPSLPRVAAATGRYTDDLRHVARAAGFSSGGLLLDLTGHSPGASVVLNARPAADYWLYGGYPGSTVYVRHLVERVPCRELSHAWILTEPGGARAVVPEDVGILTGNYTVAGSVTLPPGEMPDGATQVLLRPTASADAMVRGCESARGPRTKRSAGNDSAP